MWKGLNRCWNFMESGSESATYESFAYSGYRLGDVNTKIEDPCVGSWVRQKFRMCRLQITNYNYITNCVTTKI